MIPKRSGIGLCGVEVFRRRSAGPHPQRLAARRPPRWCSCRAAGVLAIHVLADITLFDTTDYPIHVAGEVKDFDVSQYMDGKDARRHDRNTHFAVAASGEALRDAGLLNAEGMLDTAQADPDRFGMIVGTAIGGIGMIADGLATLNDRGPDRVSPFLLPHMIPDAASGMVAIQYGIRGPNLAVVSACATGGHAIGEAMETIVRGQADLMLGAGTEAVIVPIAFAGFGQMRALGTPIDPDTGAYDPTIASRPFDATRNGFVVVRGLHRCWCSKSWSTRAPAASRRSPR